MRSAKDQELIVQDQQFQDELRSIEEMLFNIVLKNARILNIGFQDALASSGCSLKMQRKLLQMAQDQGVFAV